MKKTLIVIALVLLAVSGVFAQVSVEGQTILYKYIETVDPDTGVRSTNRNFWSGINDQVPTEIYITFTKNGCYTSDEKGNKKYYHDGIHVDGNALYNYQGEQNNMFVFNAYNKSSGNLHGSVFTYEKTIFLYFSKDYKRINLRNSQIIDGKEGYLNRIFIYERFFPPRPVEPPKPPTQMW